MTGARAAFDLSGHRVLVTGASAGIGHAVSVALAELGADVLLSGRDEGRLAAVAADLGPRCAGTFPIDLAEMDAIPGWMKDTVCAEGALNGLVHCAGIQETRPVRSVTEAAFDETLHTNLGSALTLARGLRQKACRGTPCAMVLMASVAAFIGQPGNVVYAASKGGIVSATRALAMELLRDNIRVNAVAPALVETEMAERSRATMTDAQFQHMLDQHPMGIGKPEDVAHPVVFLLSDAARWMTGQCLHVDGGYLCR